VETRVLPVEMCIQGAAYKNRAQTRLCTIHNDLFTLGTDFNA